jgi:hypothetical protein
MRSSPTSGSTIVSAGASPVVIPVPNGKKVMGSRTIAYAMLQQGRRDWVVSVFVQPATVAFDLDLPAQRVPASRPSRPFRLKARTHGRPQEGRPPSTPPRHSRQIASAADRSNNPGRATTKVMKAPPVAAARRNRVV